MGCCVTVITTDSVLLDKPYKAALLKEDVEQELKDLEYLGCQQVVWLEKGLPYKQTGGYVAAFVCESEVHGAGVILQGS